MPKKPAIKKLDEYGVVDVGASDPAVATDGELYFNSTESSLKIWLNGSWLTLASLDPSGGLDNLLLTNGDNFLLTADSGEDVLLLTSA